MWFRGCTLIDNWYASLLFSQTMFSYCFCMLSEFSKSFWKESWRVQVAHLHNAPIIGLPQDGGVGQPRGIRLRKKHTRVGILTSTTIPGVGNLTRLPSWKVERIWEWVTSDAPSWKIPRIHLSESPAWMAERKLWRSIVLFLKQKCYFMPISALF